MRQVVQGGGEGQDSIATWYHSLGISSTSSYKSLVTKERRPNFLLG